MVILYVSLQIHHFGGLLLRKRENNNQCFDAISYGLHQRLPNVSKHGKHHFPFIRIFSVLLDRQNRCQHKLVTTPVTPVGL